MKYNGRKVPFGKYLVVWGPGDKDRGVVNDIRMSGGANLEGGGVHPLYVRNQRYMLSIILKEKSTGDDRHLHFVNKPVIYVREVKVKNPEIYDLKGWIFLDAPISDCIDIYHIIKRDERFICILTKEGDRFYEYTFIQCPLMMDLRA